MHYNCPLCLSKQTKDYYFQEIFSRHYYQCENCDLVFVPSEQQLTKEDEKKHYSHHQNDIRSPGYERFLSRLIKPVEKYFSLSAKGLDFGQGPYPMLLEILKERGFDNVKGYDPLFNNNTSIFKEKYDFITSCEVIEHIKNLKFEIERLLLLIKDNGILVVSTGLRSESQSFDKWGYIQDITHVSIFSQKTFLWIANKYQLEVEFPEQDIIVLRK